MVERKVTIKKSVADSIAKVSWFIESKGLVTAAEKYSDSIYDYFLSIANKKISHPICKDPHRALLGYKCSSFKKKYTVVFLESDEEIIICEFLPSKLINW